MTRIKPSYPRLNRSHPLAAGLVGCYPMCEGGGKTLQDLSGRNANGTFSGTTLPVWTAAVNGGGLYFNGSSSVTLPLPPFTGPPFSVNVLFRETANSTIWFYGTNSSTISNGYYLTYNGTNGSTGVGTTVLNAFNSVTAPADTSTIGQWKVCGGVWASTTLRTAYLNGVPGTSGTASAAPTSLDTHALGIYPPYAGSNANGTIAAVMVWNRALSDAEMAIAAQDLLAVVRPKRWKTSVTVTGTTTNGFQPVWTTPSTVHVGWGL